MQAFHSSCSDSHMKKIAATAASEFCKWVMIEIGVCIHNQKYHVKPHSSLWLSDALAAAIAQKKLLLFVATEYVFYVKGKLKIFFEELLKLLNLFKLIKQES